MRVDPYELLDEIKEWLTSGGSIDGVFFDQESIISAIDEAVAQRKKEVPNES